VDGLQLILFGLRGIALAPDIRIGRSSQLLRQLQHERLVRLGHAHDLHDHMQRIMPRQILSEISATALRHSH